MDQLPKHAEISARAQTGERFRTKAAIRRALDDAPGFIEWQVVGTVVNDFQDYTLTTTQLIDAINESANLTGPDPYRDRRYYGTVTVKAGKLVIK